MIVWRLEEMFFSRSNRALEMVLCLSPRVSSMKLCAKRGPLRMPAILQPQQTFHSQNGGLNIMASRILPSFERKPSR
jgi:hypothetical protein